MALKMSSNFALVTVMQFGALANDESLATAALERVTSMSDAPAAAIIDTIAAASLPSISAA